MKVLFAASIPFPEGRANTRRIHTIAKEMVSQGQEVSLLIPFARHPGPSTSEIDGIQVDWCYVPRSVESLITKAGYVRFSVQIISRILFMFTFICRSLTNKYDWLYLYQPGLEGLMAAAIARVTGHRVCSEYVDKLSTDDYPGFFRKCIYITLQIADLVVPRMSSVIFVISSELERRYRKLSPHAKISILPTIVDSDLFKTGNPERYRQEFGLINSKVIVYTGSFTRPQGVKSIVEALLLVVKEHPSARLLIAGGSMSPDSDNISDLITEYNLSKYIVYLGVLNLHDVIDLLAAADLFVLPKLNHVLNHAGLSTKLAEYLAVGRPVVASSVGDVPLYLQNEVHALLCEPGNVQELASNICKLLSNDALAKQIGKQGQLLASEVFGVKPNVSRVLSILDKN